MLEVGRGQFRLTDSGSALGTLVNGEAVTALNLSPGDTIQIGATTLILSLADIHDRVTNTEALYAGPSPSRRRRVSRT